MLAVVAITLLSGHVAPSVDTNNRYLKLTPLGDRVRLAYTVFYGQIPGASERAAIDTDHDGQISDAEARAFAGQLAAQVAGALAIEVDGAPVTVHWDEIDPGMNTPDVAAGAFSIDLIASLCLAHGPGHHHVRVRDRLALPRPGEAEARVEDSPDVTVERAHVGSADDPSHDYLFTGAAAPLASDGLDLEFTVGPDAVVAGDRCRSSAGARADGGAAGSHLLGWVAIAAVAGALVLVLVLIAVRRRRT